ncbi:MAG: ROK family protein [Eubacteriales bacterium]
MYYIGVDLGGTNIAIGIVNEEQKIIEKGSVPTLPSRAPELIVNDIADLAGSLLHKQNIPLSQVAYAGIATPGSTNNQKGIVYYSNNLPFQDFPMAEVFRKYLPVRQVYIENDANAAAWAEAVAGVARGASISVMVTLGTGVGGGIIIDGKIFSGFNYAAGELGHIVIKKDGRLCTCGRRGCWETYSSAPGLVLSTREKMTECRTKGIPTLLQSEADAHDGKVNARTAFDAMKKGDVIAKSVVDEYIEDLACGITNIINIFQPEVLSIGGGICNEGDYLLQPLLRILDREQYTRDNKEKARVLIAALGNDAGIIGAAGLGRTI